MMRGPEPALPGTVLSELTYVSVMTMGTLVGVFDTAYVKLCVEPSNRPHDSEVVNAPFTVPAVESMGIRVMLNDAVTVRPESGVALITNVCPLPQYSL